MQEENTTTSVAPKSESTTVSTDSPTSKTETATTASATLELDSPDLGSSQTPATEFPITNAPTETVGFGTTVPGNEGDSQYCFPNKGELQAAVDNYIEQDCTNNSGCEAGQIYGWPIGTWCVSLVTDMSFLFRDKPTFNEDISKWDVSSVTDMWGMFAAVPSFNQDISKWNISSVTDMGDMLNANC